MSPHENTRKKRRLSAEAEGDDAVPTKKARTDDERTEPPSSSAESDSQYRGEFNRFLAYHNATVRWQEWMARAAERSKAETARDASSELQRRANAHYDEMTLALRKAGSASGISTSPFQTIAAVNDALQRWCEAAEIKEQAEASVHAARHTYWDAAAAADGASVSCVDWLCVNRAARSDDVDELPGTRFSERFKIMFPDSGAWGEEFKAVLKRLADATDRDD